jgi:flagellum-specific peptidoglycan hydrolase FlgJ
MKQFTVFLLLTGAVLFILGGTHASHQEKERESTFRLLAQNREGNTTNTATSAQKEPAATSAQKKPAATSAQKEPAATPAETPEKNQKQPQQREVEARPAPQGIPEAVAQEPGEQEQEAVDELKTRFRKLVEDEMKKR